MATPNGNRDSGRPHLTLVPPPPEPPRLMLRLPPGMTVEKWHATLAELRADISELRALDAEMRATLRGDERF